MEFSYSFLENFIWADAWVLIPVLFIVGMILRQTPKVFDWIIPWTQMAIGVVFCLINYGLIIQSVVQGILVAGAAMLIQGVVYKPGQTPEPKNQEENNHSSKQGDI